MGTKISELLSTTDLQASDDFIIERGAVANYKVSYSTLKSELQTDMGLNTTNSPTFVTVKLTSLTDSYVPYHASDASGLANSNATYNSSTGNWNFGGNVNATGLTINNVPVGTSTDSYWSNDGGGNIYYNSGKVGINTTTPTSSLHSGGSTALSCTTITSSATAGSYTTYFIDASSGEVILTLPSASSCSGRIYHITRTQTYPSSYNCIVACQSGETINGVGSVALENNYDRITVQSNGSGWIIIGR